MYSALTPTTASALVSLVLDVVLTQDAAMTAANGNDDNAPSSKKRSSADVVSAAHAAEAAASARLTPWVVAMAHFDEDPKNGPKTGLSNVVTERVVSAVEASTGPLASPLLALIKDKLVPVEFLETFQKAKQTYDTAVETAEATEAAASKLSKSAPTVSKVTVVLQSFVACQSLSKHELKEHIPLLRLKLGKDVGAKVRGSKAQLVDMLWSLAKPTAPTGCDAKCSTSHTSGLCLVCNQTWTQHSASHTCQGPQFGGRRASWPVPQGCPPTCSRDHSSHGNCLNCGRGWGPHNGHTCTQEQNGQRGSWRDPSNPAVAPPQSVILMTAPSTKSDGVAKAVSQLPLLNPAQLLARLLAKTMSKQLVKHADAQAHVALRQVLLSLLRAPVSATASSNVTLSGLRALAELFKFVTPPAEDDDEEDDDEEEDEEDEASLLAPVRKTIIPPSITVEGTVDVALAKQNIPTNGSWSFSTDGNSITFPYGPIQVVSTTAVPLGPVNRLTWTFQCTGNTFFVGVVPDSKVVSSPSTLKECTVGCFIADNGGGSSGGAPQYGMRDRRLRVVADSLTQKCEIFSDDVLLHTLNIAAEHWPVRLQVCGYSGTKMVLSPGDPQSGVTPADVLAKALKSKSGKGVPMVGAALLAAAAAATAAAAAAAVKPKSKPSKTTLGVRVVPPHRMLSDVLEYALTGAFVLSAQTLDILRSRSLPFGPDETNAVSFVQPFLKIVAAVAHDETSWGPVYTTLVRSLLMPRAALYYRSRFAALLSGAREASFSVPFIVTQLESITRMERHLASLMDLPASRVSTLLKDVRKSLYASLLVPESHKKPVLVPACKAFVSDGLVRCLMAYVPMVTASTTRDINRWKSQLRGDRVLIDMRSQFRVLSADPNVARALVSRWSDLIFEVVWAQLLSAAPRMSGSQLMTGLLSSLTLFQALATALFDGHKKFSKKAVAQGFMRAWVACPAAVMVEASKQLVAFFDSFLDATFPFATAAARYFCACFCLFISQARGLFHLFSMLSVCCSSSERVSHAFFVVAFACALFVLSISSSAPQRHRVRLFKL